MRAKVKEKWNRDAWYIDYWVILDVYIYLFIGIPQYYI